MKKRKNTVPKPQTWLYVPVRWLCCLIARTAFGLRVTGRENLPQKGPLLVLAEAAVEAAQSAAFAALKGRKAQFVATQRQFRNPKLHWLYVRLGVIPKVQFHTDPRCVMNIFRVLREGGTVVLFPAGQTSMWGVPGAIAPSIAHLVKKAGATVCTLGLRGGFFTAPRFGGLHFGRTEARLERAFTPQELRELSEEEILDRLERGLYFDEYAWQQETGATFRGRDLARGYDRILFRCPRCGGSGTWKSQGDVVRCTACGNSGRIGRDMRMEPVGEEDRVFPTLTQWYTWQEAQVREAIGRPDFLLRQAVRCLIFQEEGFCYREAGEGVLELDREEIRYRGSLDGQPVCLAIRHEHLPGLSAEPGVYVELYHQGYGLVRYATPCGAGVSEIKLAQEYLYRQTLKP